MKLLLIVLLPLSAAAAEPRKCANGFEPHLSGDAFSPVECSTATAKAHGLDGVPAEPKGARLDLKDLAGRWEGFLSRGVGRYELLLTVTAHWGGKAELELEAKEQQFRERVSDALALVPAKGKGAYAATMTTALVPGAALKGTLQIGGTAEERQLDVAFANGAAHRIRLRAKGKDELEAAIESAVPGAPLQTFTTVLKRTKREKL